jgi:hypothetical protein|tara:strand:+ start:1607 stop:2188 length:582 start_codon:yes stop_codon:yes gene_type:complete
MSKTQSGFEPLLDTAEDPAIEFFNLSNKLNRMQRVFVWNVVNNPQMSYVECARKSGYKDARQSAYKLLKHPIVKQEINYLLGEVRKKYELNQERAVKDLYDIRDQALEQGSFNAAIAAQNSLLKVGGLIVDKKEVRYGKIDQMSRAEIENRLKQLMGEVIEGEIAEETDESASTSVLDPLAKSDNHDNQEVDE